MLATYGERALTFLRRLLDSPDQEIQRQATQALQVISDISGLRVELRPFRGIYVECLGDLRVFVNGRAITSENWAQYDGGRAGARKVQGLFAYLIHAGGQGATRDAIGAMVWGGTVSQSSLARTLSSLRQVISRVGSPELAEQALVVSRDLCRIEPSIYQTDAGLFERTFNVAYRTEVADGLDAAVPLYVQARALYTGPYMAEIPHSSDWAQELRDLLMSDFVISSERLAEYEYQQGHHQRCIALCREALTADPAAEDVTSWLLRACAQLGLRTEFERTFQRYQAVSALDAESSERDTVVHLYQHLRQQLDTPGRRRIVLA
jgi:DNA-binding SARP family transcriptional activator